MAEVVLFHHALGLTPGIVAFADRLRAAGHTVHTPDMYEGRLFDTVEAGVAHAQQVGFEEVVGRGVRAAEGVAPGAFYAGYSLGAMPAQLLAQTRPGAAGAVLLAGCVPATEFGPGWPAQVPVQIHAAEADPWFAEDAEAARELAAGAEAGELFRYPGDEHLFLDSSAPGYDAEAAELVLQRVLGLLATAA
ncbi:dienelactone hydrolase family protein [Kitasatospora sp. NPDC002227]|uniref:dienelactone hydrolase family protein n=1 Tax=Kitasatospora sp. NPDC002227 TaxID=3154773 RepID=UPI003331143A